MVEGGRKIYSAGDTIEEMFVKEGSNDEKFDCGYANDIIPDSEIEGVSESSDVDTHIEGIL